MSFPIYYQGKILFREGLPAFSTDCCCETCVSCRYFYYEFSEVDINDFVPGPAPEPFGSTLYYFGKGFAADGNYLTYLWIWEACITTTQRMPYNLFSDEIEAFHNANQAAIGAANMPFNFGEPSASGGNGTNNYWIDSMKHQYLDSYSDPNGLNGSVEDLLVGVPPFWLECGPE